jgi:hypothetical protein
MKLATDYEPSAKWYNLLTIKALSLSVAKGVINIYIV